MSVKIYDDIVLFGRKTFEWDSKNRKDTEKVEKIDFYVSDANNKNTLKTGKNWATTTRWTNNESIVVEPLVIHTENKGFKLSLDSSADYSSQGGKLSFWMCRIDKDDIHGRIGINQEELNQLFKESTFVNGVCQQDICFYRINGNVGACVVGGERYKEFYQEKDRDIKLSKAKKTTKWELGRVYESKTIKSVWIGDVTNYFTGEKHHLILDVDENDKSITDVLKHNWLYKDMLKDNFPSRIASEVIFDIKENSNSLALKSKDDLMEVIKGMVGCINSDDYYYGSSLTYDKWWMYYIDKNNFQYGLIVDYLKLIKYYFTTTSRRTRSDNEIVSRVDSMLNKLGCHNVVNESIFNKYKDILED